MAVVLQVRVFEYWFNQETHQSGRLAVLNRTGQEALFSLPDFDGEQRLKCLDLSCR